MQNAEGSMEKEGTVSCPWFVVIEASTPGESRGRIEVIQTLNDSFDSFTNSHFFSAGAFHCTQNIVAQVFEMFMAASSSNENPNLNSQMQGVAGRQVDASRAECDSTTQFRRGGTSLRYVFETNGEP